MRSLVFSYNLHEHALYEEKNTPKNYVKYYVEK